MTAIITDILKKQLVKNVFDEVNAGSQNYYIGIGRSEQWNSTETVPDPTDTPRTIRNTRSGIQSIKKVEGTSFVIPRYNWSSGAIYNAFDDDLTAIPSNSYYVITEDNQVYICLQQGKDANGNPVTSTVKPNSVDLTKPFKNADGYVWKFLYTLSAARASKFLSANFVPVERVVADSAGVPTLNVTEAQQKQVDSNAVPGQILGVALINGGTGYDPASPPAVTINGDGVRAAATATVSGGAVVKVELDSSTDSAIKMGQGYNFASVTIAAPSSGITATARAIIGPDSGLGADPRDELKATSLMFNIKPDGEVSQGAVSSKTFIINQDFRQVALIRNPFESDSAATGKKFTAASGLMLQSLRVTDSSEATSFAVDAVVTGSGSGAKAVIDKIETTTGFHPQLIVHQNDSTGFKPFTEGEAITGGAGAASLVGSGIDADADAFSVNDIRKTSGEILYIENRAPVVRASGQTEDIKVVITL